MLVLLPPPYSQMRAHPRSLAPRPTTIRFNQRLKQAIKLGPRNARSAGGLYEPLALGLFFF